MDLYDIINSIRSPDASCMEVVRSYFHDFVQPAGSFGDLESYVIRLAGIARTTMPDISKRALLVFCADHGVCKELDEMSSQETQAAVENLVNGTSGTSILCDVFDVELMVADIGMQMHFAHPDVQNFRICEGSGNIRIEDAMTLKQAQEAICRGIVFSQEAIVRGNGIIGVGTVHNSGILPGIAVLSALTGIDTDMLVEDDASALGESQQKRFILRDAMRRCKPKASEVLRILSKFGGFDLCAMVGAYLGAAAANVPIVLDGYTSCIAALAAVRLAPRVQPFLFASHMADQPGSRLVFSELGLSPPLSLHIKLGEGSGCPMMFSLLDAACALFFERASQMHSDLKNTFDMQ